MKIIIILFLALIILLFVCICASTLFIIRRGEQSLFQSEGKDEISLKSFDGLRLVADIVNNDAAAKGTVLCFHGYHSGPVRDFSDIHTLYTGLGYRSVFVHQRAHGKSEGSFTCLGIKERRDCLDWILHINALYGKEKPLFLSGVSMGAASVLMASGTALPENVKGIIADCGFTSPKEILMHIMKNKYRLPPALLLSVMTWVIKKAAGYRLDEYSTVDAMKKNKLPVLFIHGKEDRFVPCDMTLKNYDAANENCSLLLVEGARHAKSYGTDPERYRQTVKDFILKYEH